MARRRIRSYLSKYEDDLVGPAVVDCPIVEGPKTFDDLFSWTCIMKGVDGTPYQDCIFHLDIDFPSDHPFTPPKVRFVTKVYHPQINNDGSIYCDVLMDNWSPALSIRKVLIMIRSCIFTHHVMLDPGGRPPRGTNQEAYKLLQSDILQYMTNILECSRKHGQCSRPIVSNMNELKHGFFHFLSRKFEEYQLNPSLSLAMLVCEYSGHTDYHPFQHHQPWVQYIDSLHCHVDRNGAPGALSALGANGARDPNASECKEEHCAPAAVGPVGPMEPVGPVEPPEPGAIAMRGPGAVTPGWGQVIKKYKDSAKRPSLRQPGVMLCDGRAEGEPYYECKSEMMMSACAVEKQWYCLCETECLGENSWFYLPYDEKNQMILKQCHQLWKQSRGPAKKRYGKIWLNVDDRHMEIKFIEARPGVSADVDGVQVSPNKLRRWIVCDAPDVNDQIRGIPVYRER